MSANNWAICPQCEANHESEMTRKTQSLEESYGKIPAEEYLSRLEELRAFKKNGPSATPETLREDYEIGITCGDFYINYRAGCNVCGFSYEHKDEKRLTITPQRREKD